MGRTWKLSVLLLVLGVLLSGIYFGRVPRAEAGAQKKPTRKQQLAGAKTLYVENCARCHGADGRSQTQMGELYNATDLTDAQWWKKGRPSDKRLAASIRDGLGGMPAFGKKLSKDEIAALVAFVKTFNGK
ncbi:MAG TPA: cytochrome c [Pyrinomonadaceae bacterium]|nr:cytochrome c [Pyrinomonadaceae bacterium]